MTATQSFYLQMLSDYLNKRKTGQPTVEVDWSELARIAKQQQTEGIAHIQCGKYIPDEFRHQLSRNFALENFNYVTRCSMLSEIDTAFQKAGIEWFSVKGTAVAKLCPVPEVRTMGDCDIVVHTEDKPNADEILQELGFRLHSKGNHEWVYFKKRLEFELHDHLLYKETVNAADLMAFTEKCWDYVRDGILDWSFHLLFLLIHLRKHLLNSGAGFRQFMDVAAVVQSVHDLDWDWIKVQLDSLKMLSFAEVCFSLVEYWFEVSSPLKIHIPKSQLDEITEKTFANGVFGFEDIRNRNNHTFNIAHSKKHPYLAVLLHSVGAFFPSYKDLCETEIYSFVQGKPYLLPAAWGYRAVRGTYIYGLGRLGALLKKSYISPKELSEKEHTLSNLGLNTQKDETKNEIEK